MRIIHYLRSMDLHDGGVVRAVLDLCPALVEAGHQVTLLTCEDVDVPAAWKGLGAWHGGSVPVCVTLPGPLMPGGLLGRRAMILARSVIAGADVAHLHAMWIPSNDQIARACRVGGTPYIVSPHGMLDDWCMEQKSLKKRVYHALLERRLLERAAAVHCTAEAELAQARKWFGGAAGEVVPLPFDLADYQHLPGPELARAKFGFRDDQPAILFLSRLHPKKGVGVLIEAAGLLCRRGRNVRVIVAGGGDAAYERGLRETVERLDLGDHVQFVGFVKGREKVSLYQAASAFVLPSSQENFGYVVVEAMAARTPVITTRGVALWPQLERERAAALVEPEPSAIAQSIERVLDDAPGSAAMAERGRAWCMRELDPSRIIAGFVDMYARAAGTRAGAAAAAR